MSPMAKTKKRKKQPGKAKYARFRHKVKKYKGWVRLKKYKGRAKRKSTTQKTRRK